MITIYGLIDPRTDELRYVGITKNLRKRLWRHCHPNPSNKTHRAQWIRALCALGLKPEPVLLEEASSDEEAAVIERFWIASLRAAGTKILNFADGGEGGDTRSGCKLTPEHRAKIAAAHRGMKASAEARAKMSAVRRGLRHSEQARQRRAANARRGYKRPPAIGQKITEALKQQ